MDTQKHGTDFWAPVSGICKRTQCLRSIFVVDLRITTCRWALRQNLCQTVQINLKLGGTPVHWGGLIRSRYVNQLTLCKISMFLDYLCTCMLHSLWQVSNQIQPANKKIPHLGTCGSSQHKTLLPPYVRVWNFRQIFEEMMFNTCHELWSPEENYITDRPTIHRLFHGK